MLPNLVEQYLRALPDLVSQMPVILEYWLIGHKTELPLEGDLLRSPLN